MKARADKRAAFAVLAALAGLSACVEARVTERAAPVPDVSLSSSSCPAPVAAPLRDLVFENLYLKSDPYHATINEAARAAWIEETADAQRFGNALLRMSNGYLRTGGAGEARCVLSWLDSWAREDALLGKTSDKGIAARQWMLATFSGAWGQVRGAEGMDEGQARRVEDWLRAVAHAVVEDYPPDAKRASRLNNHLHWAAWAVTSAGMALEDPVLYHWGIARARRVLREQVEEDGTLPLETARGPRALQYHVFATGPLVMLAEAAARHGDDLYAERGGILRRLVERVVEGVEDPRYFATKAGVEQLPAGALHEGHFGWLEAYGRRFPSRKIEGILAPRRPLFSRQTGGDMTFLYR